MADVRFPYQIPTIHTTLVVIETADGRRYGFDTATQVSIEKREEVTDGIVLNPKAILRAQVLEQVTPTGHELTLTDNILSPELMQIFEGGVLQYSPTDPSKIIGYRSPVVGSSVAKEKFTLYVYSSIYDASGEISGYERATYLGCEGRGVVLDSEDGAFRVPEYTVISAPNVGQSTIIVDWIPVEDFPVIVGQVPLSPLKVTSAASGETGNTVISITPTPSPANFLAYYVDTAPIRLPADRELVDLDDWTLWDGSADIAAATGSYIAVVEISANDRAVAGGTTTVTSAA